MKLTLQSTRTLNNGVEIPILGFGTYRAKRGGETVKAVKHALEVGYRHIDTAAIYGNEEDVGQAIRESGVPREDIFVTSKLWNTDHGADRAAQAFETSLKKLQLDYLDLYLIHWPVEEFRLETWKVLEDLYKEGRVRAIGVSNYMTWHLEELLKEATVIPQANQVEFSLYLNQQTLLSFCTSDNIAVEAYSPLTKGRKLNDPPLLEIAKKYNKSPAQILLRWGIQQGLIVLAKSVNPERIAQNAEIFDFEISPKDMTVLDSFNQDLRTGWDPSTQKLWRDSR